MATLLSDLGDLASPKLFYAELDAVELNAEHGT